MPDVHRQYQLEKVDEDKYRNMSSSFENIYDDVDLALYASPDNEVDYDDRKPKRRTRRHPPQRDDGYQPYPLPHASQYRRDGYTLPPQQPHGHQGPQHGMYHGHQGGHPDQSGYLGHPGLQDSYPGHPGSQRHLDEQQAGRLQSAQVQFAPQPQEGNVTLEGATGQAPPRGDSNDQGQIPQKVTLM